MVPESFSKRSKCRFARAVTRCHVFHLISVMECRHHFLDVRITCDDKMKPADNHVDVRVDANRRSNNPIDTRMRTTHNDHHPVRSVDGQ